MSFLEHSPTRTAGAGGSHPDLYGLTKKETDSLITLRKRKRECDCSDELKEIRCELRGMTTLLEKFMDSNAQIMSQMQENISEVKTQISELKTSNEQTLCLIRDNVTELKSQINDIKSASSSLATEQNNMKILVSDLNTKVSIGENHMKSLETEVKDLKLTSLSGTSHGPASQSYTNEQIIREVYDRKEREKNILISGILEQTPTTAEERISKDVAEVMKITSAVDKDIAKPIKVFRIGKYNSNKNRRIKVCYHTDAPVKQLLRNKDKLPTNIKVYSDQTPTQQKYLQDVKEELIRRQNSGETDLTIKYITGTPKIIKTSPKNSQPQAPPRTQL